MPRIKMLTKEILRKLPPLGTHQKNLNEAVAQVKYFDPTGSGSWFGVEYDPEQRIMWGWVTLFPGEGEYGYFGLAELESVVCRFGLKIERDKWFSPTPMKTVIEAYGQRR